MRKPRKGIVDRFLRHLIFSKDFHTSLIWSTLSLRSAGERIRKKHKAYLRCHWTASFLLIQLNMGTPILNFTVIFCSRAILQSFSKLLTMREGCRRKDNERGKHVEQTNSGIPWETTQRPSRTWKVSVYPSENCSCSIEISFYSHPLQQHSLPLLWLFSLCGLSFCLLTAWTSLLRSKGSVNIFPPQDLSMIRNDKRD